MLNGFHPIFVLFPEFHIGLLVLPLFGLYPVIVGLTRILTGYELYLWQLFVVASGARINAPVPAYIAEVPGTTDWLYVL